MQDIGKFSCSSCQRTYAWKPELAGKKVRCKCGGVMAVPNALQPAGGAPDEPDLDDLYQLAEDKSKPAPQQDAGGGMRCPSCQADLEPGAMLCLSCGMNFKTGKKMSTSLSDDAPHRGASRGAKPVLAMAGGGAAVATAGGALPRTLGYAGRNPRAQDRDAENAKGMVKNLTWPIVMVGVGLILGFVYFQFMMHTGPLVAIIATGIYAAIGMVFITVGCLIGIKLMDMSLGAPAEAALKILALALVPPAVDALISDAVAGGFFLGMVVSLALYWVMLSWFFDLDAGEVMILSTIIWALRFWVGNIVLVVILTSVMGIAGAGGGGGGGGGRAASTGFFGGSSAKTDNSPAGKINSRAEKLKMTLDSGEAEDWLEKDTRHRLYGMTPEDSLKKVRALYEAGAEDVHTGEINKRGELIESDKLVVELPEDAAARKAVMAVLVPFMQSRDPELMPIDHGPDQVYVIYHLDGNDD